MVWEKGKMMRKVEMETGKLEDRGWVHGRSLGGVENRDVLMGGSGALTILSVGVPLSMDV